MTERLVLTRLSQAGGQLGMPEGRDAAPPVRMSSRSVRTRCTPEPA